MTTTEQYVDQIADYMARYPKRSRSDVVVALIRTAVITGGTLADVEQILAADKLAMQMTFDALDATIAEIDYERTRRVYEETLNRLAEGRPVLSPGPCCNQEENTR